VDSPAPKEKTDFLYRFELTVPAGKSDRLTVKEQQVADQGFAILDGDMDSLIAFSRTGTIPQAVKDALIKAAGLKRAAADAQRQLDQDAQREAAIAKDQRRIDENLRTIDKTSQLYARLVQKLDDQETELDKLRADEDTVTKQLNDLNQQLQNYLANLNVG
jgi:septal ring factor EnvC (AmiA/AmiB activator)